MNGKTCPYCSRPMSESTIIQVGIKLYKNEKPCLYYISSCNNCDNQSHTTIFTDTEFSAQQLAAEIYNSYTDEKSSYKKETKAKRKGSCKAFESDCKKLSEFMRDCDDHNQFLKFIGLTDSEIEFYNSKDGELKKDDIS